MSNYNDNWSCGNNTAYIRMNDTPLIRIEVYNGEQIYITKLSC